MKFGSLRENDEKARVEGMFLQVRLYCKQAISFASTTFKKPEPPERRPKK
jgi:hypothetical protein